MRKHDPFVASVAFDILGWFTGHRNELYIFDE
jgi:hypothetical protein